MYNNDNIDRIGLRGYVQFYKYAHTDTHKGLKRNGRFTWNKSGKSINQHLKELLVS